jgi:hypothetical protein
LKQRSFLLSFFPLFPAAEQDEDEEEDEDEEDDEEEEDKGIRRSEPMKTLPHLRDHMCIHVCMQCIHTYKHTNACMHACMACMHIHFDA